MNCEFDDTVSVLQIVFAVDYFATISCGSVLCTSLTVFLLIGLERLRDASGYK